MDKYSVTSITNKGCISTHVIVGNFNTAYNIVGLKGSRIIYKHETGDFVDIAVYQANYGNTVIILPIIEKSSIEE